MTTQADEFDYLREIRANGYEVPSTLSGAGTLLRALHGTDPREVATILGEVLDTAAQGTATRLCSRAGTPRREDLTVTKDQWWAFFPSAYELAGQLAFSLHFLDEPIAYTDCTSIDHDVSTGGPALEHLILILSRAVFSEDDLRGTVTSSPDEPWVLYVPFRGTGNVLDHAALMAADRAGVTINGSADGRRANASQTDPAARQIDEAVALLLFGEQDRSPDHARHEQNLACSTSAARGREHAWQDHEVQATTAIAQSYVRALREAGTPLSLEQIARPHSVLRATSIIRALQHVGVLSTHSNGLVSLRVSKEPPRQHQPGHALH